MGWVGLGWFSGGGGCEGGLVWFGLVGFELVCFGSWFGLVWFDIKLLRLFWFGLEHLQLHHQTIIAGISLLWKGNLCLLTCSLDQPDGAVTSLFARAGLGLVGLSHLSLLLRFTTTLPD
jgi:hypothetical protein